MKMSNKTFDILKYIARYPLVIATYLSSPFLSVARELSERVMTRFCGLIALTEIVKFLDSGSSGSLSK